MDQVVKEGRTGPEGKFGSQELPVGASSGKALMSDQVVAALPIKPDSKLFAISN